MLPRELQEFDNVIKEAGLKVDLEALGTHAVLSIKEDGSASNILTIPDTLLIDNFDLKHMPKETILQHMIEHLEFLLQRA